MSFLLQGPGGGPDPGGGPGGVPGGVPRGLGGFGLNSKFSFRASRPKTILSTPTPCTTRIGGPEGGLQLGPGFLAGSPPWPRHPTSVNPPPKKKKKKPARVFFCVGVLILKGRVCTSTLRVLFADWLSQLEGGIHGGSLLRPPPARCRGRFPPPATHPRRYLPPWIPSLLST